MPHLHLEYTRNLPLPEPETLLLRLNHALMASGQIASESDIKSRAVEVQAFRVGTAPGERGFLFLKLALLSGRSDAVKKQLSDALLEVLKQAADWPKGVDVQFGVEIVDMQRESYGKHRVSGL
jgi:5-carboxymethyl-2-hydroxymuconate isomerase